MTEQDTRLVAVNDHIRGCGKCTRARKRVNNFCDAGRALFLLWAENEKPISATVLDEETSRRVIEQEMERRRKARRN